MRILLIIFRQFIILYKFIFFWYTLKDFEKSFIFWDTFVKIDINIWHTIILYNILNIIE